MKGRKKIDVEERVDWELVSSGRYDGARGMVCAARWTMTDSSVRKLTLFAVDIFPVLYRLFANSTGIVPKTSAGWRTPYSRPTTHWAAFSLPPVNAVNGPFTTLGCCVHVT